MNKTIKQILTRYKRIWALGHSFSLFGWDSWTYMPKAGFHFRGEARAELSILMQEMYLSLKPLVEKASKERDLDDSEKGTVRVLQRAIERYERIPPELIMEIERAASKALPAWESARASSDFKKFQPHLSRLVGLKMKVAEKMGYDRHPYDALLDMNEEGFTVKDADAIFRTLLPKSKSILNRAVSEGYFPTIHPLERMKYRNADLEGVNGWLVELLGLPKDRSRLDLSTHPFTSSLSVDDVRITTRYEGTNFCATMFSVMHESGHAIYELQIDRALECTPLVGAASLGIHESQSRFFENTVGRSRVFLDLTYPELKKRLPFLKGYTKDDLYKYFNMIRPGTIRVDSDEIVYNAHIAVRYELEKMLITNKLGTKELPQAWDELTEKYTGRRPKNDREGVLQDIHWTNGPSGYFPTYTLGNLVAAMIGSKMPGIDEKIRNGEFNEIKSYLQRKIHRYGSIYSPKELLKKSFGDTYNPKYFISYLEEKYLKFA